MTTYGASYAGRYDALYRDKNYDGECDLLESVFRKYANGVVASVLDIGCGTGNHALRLAGRGYNVTGVDRSSEMLEQARHKADAEQPKSGTIEFRNGDAQTLNLNRQFDAALMMFAVLGYQLTNDNVLASLHAVRRHLKPSALFICDFWYGPAVLAVRPTDRVKTISTDAGTMIRSASTTLDTFRHIAAVHYRMWACAGSLIETAETHTVRYFFPQEVSLFLSQAGLELQQMCTFGALDREPDQESWNVMAIARAV